MTITSTKDRIRQEALRLFVERGVDAVSVRDIAKAVGMSAPNLYAHYKGRDELVADLFQAGYASYGRQLQDIADGSGSFAERLEAMIRLICRLHDADRTLFQFLLLNQHTHLNRVAPDDSGNPMAVLHRLITKAVEAGEMPIADPALLTAAVVGIVVQAATFRLYGRISRDLEPMADEIIALCAKVLA
ncbi:TetR/AcrR family transcriptional regulator [Lacibacterium aquatile]